ncbi:5-(carboxyamino)imidazole ribonucleotide synthase [uncultured Abyssibacter sp.]|uniref:5-(carboxyamino)imidazole ribonucleotide synthase n=1 Tax=uncultured Abyssibacter sp. TaxID=2320202 RepID=UPI0032B2A198
MKLAIFGGGQLGRMLALAALPLDVRCQFLDPVEAPCAAAAGRHIRGDYEDPAALEAFAQGADSATYEFENVPVAAVEHVARLIPAAPGAVSLACAQDRGHEKQLFEDLDIAVAPWAEVNDAGSLSQAAATVGLPAVLKTRRFGYDGKGQVVIRGADELDAAWDAVGAQPCVLEAFVPFQREVSMIGVRSREGEIRCYTLTENVHRDGILRRSTPVEGDALQPAAEAALSKVMRALDHVGVMAFEFFVAEGRLLANEIAPRVHNSGHWTIDGAVCSQFENHVRAVLDLPLGETALRQPCVMLNAIGSMPATAELAAIPGVRIHAYGKSARPGRKVGHVTVLGCSTSELRRRLAMLDALIDA